jgi:adenosine deaminase
MSLNRQFGLSLKCHCNSNAGPFQQWWLFTSLFMSNLCAGNLLHANAVPFGSLDLSPFDHSKLTPI